MCMGSPQAAAEALVERYFKECDKNQVTPPAQVSRQCREERPLQGLIPSHTNTPSPLTTPNISIHTFVMLPQIPKCTAEVIGPGNPKVRPPAHVYALHNPHLCSVVGGCFAVDSKERGGPSDRGSAGAQARRIYLQVTGSGLLRPTPAQRCALQRHGRPLAMTACLIGSD
jgi:hypothetical protein